MIEDLNPFINLGGSDQKVNNLAEALLEINLTCKDLKKDLELSDNDIVDMLSLVINDYKKNYTIG
tara:strand:- start:10252 stop:10446 length:195 start_codon:yes stop_codon:yes gene_type:complete